MYGKRYKYNWRRVFTDEEDLSQENVSYSYPGYGDAWYGLKSSYML